MQRRNLITALLLGLTLAGNIGASVPMKVKAEEPSMAGYHEYILTEDEAVDHWYGVARGTYLKEGICSLTRAGKGKVSASATTNAHSVCDVVRASVYLDESEDGGNTYGQIGSWYFSEKNTSSCHGSKLNISVTSNWWYAARGGHSVTEGEKTEATSTATDALRAS